MTLGKLLAFLPSCERLAPLPSRQEPLVTPVQLSSGLERSWLVRHRLGGGRAGGTDCFLPLPSGLPLPCTPACSVRLGRNTWGWTSWAVRPCPALGAGFSTGIRGSLWHIHSLGKVLFLFCPWSCIRITSTGPAGLTCSLPSLQQKQALRPAMR